MSTAAPLQNTAAKSEVMSESSHAGVLLQRKCACGGAAVSSLTGKCVACKKNRLQAKLTVGASNDLLEQEADRVADQVLAEPANPLISGSVRHIQRFTEQSTDQTDADPTSVERALANSGRPLEPVLRQDMEQRFGHDFAKVRVHTGAAAEKSAWEVNAHAYTVGHNIVFGEGQFTPDSFSGRHLIAHELTHVLQQSRSAGNRQQVQRKDTKPLTATEKLQVAKDKLKKKYEFEEISEEHGVAWTESELKKIDAVFSKMSPEEQEQLQGVVLVLTDDLGSKVQKGKTFKIAGKTTGLKVELTRSGVNKETPLHEAGHVIHHKVIAHAKEQFMRTKPKFTDDLKVAWDKYNELRFKVPKNFFGTAEQLESLNQFNEVITQVTVAANAVQNSWGDDLKSKLDALVEAEQNLQIFRPDVERFGADISAKATLAIADQQRTVVAALKVWVNEKEKAVGPIRQLNEFVSIVKEHNLARRSFKPFTDYAKAHWPEEPNEFFAEAYKSWRNNPADLKKDGKKGKDGKALLDWFEKGAHLPQISEWERINAKIAKGVTFILTK